ncbi:MAG: hypothetical protein C0497_15375, partial [Gemmatimonas sp.]|nr:hypothetical protein [Gemmatimonas sp.]
MAHFTRREALAQLGLGAYALSGLPWGELGRGLASHTSPPNILLLTGAFMARGDIGPYGAIDIRTPHLTRLASQGTLFTDAYATAPICTPSRAAMLTGRYQQRFGLEDNICRAGECGNVETGGIPQTEFTIAQLLKRVGYATAMFGKWHLGFSPWHDPTAHGFDYALSFNDWAIDYYSHREASGLMGLYENGKPVDVPGYSTDLFAKRAAEFIEGQGNRPFFAFVSFNSALPPAQPPGIERSARARVTDQASSEPASVERTMVAWHNYPRKDYVAVIEALDNGVGHVLESLERTGLAANTLVVYTHDHGGRFPAPPLSGGAGSLQEGGIRVPLLMRWPRVIPVGRKSAQPASLLDLTPTMLSAVGAQPASSRPLDGADLLPLMQSNRTAAERSFYWRHRVWPDDGEPVLTRAVRRGPWKLLDGPRPVLTNLTV